MSKSPRTPSDIELIDDIRKGGRAENNAITFILENSSFRTPCYNYLYRRKTNKQEADEIYIESIMILDAKVKDLNFNLTSPLKAYLQGICKNVMRSKKKAEVKRYSKEESIEDDSGNIKKEASIDPEVIADLEELKRLIADEVNKLKEPHRSILLLWEQKYSFDEIADEIEKLFGRRYSIGALRQYCFRAKNEIKEKVENSSWYNDFRN